MHEKNCTAPGEDAWEAVNVRIFPLALALPRAHIPSPFDWSRMTIGRVPAQTRGANLLFAKPSWMTCRIAFVPKDNSYVVGVESGWWDRNSAAIRGPTCHLSEFAYSKRIFFSFLIKSDSRTTTDRPKIAPRPSEDLKLHLGLWRVLAPHNLVLS